ncbi:MAG: glycosyltransferase family 4 protein [Sedimentisphaeraceae bacterium JB056]
MVDRSKVLLLAPVKIQQGGIARWTRLLLDNTKNDGVVYKTIDTSVFYRVLGGRTGLVDRFCGLKQGLIRGFNLISSILSFKPDIVYFTCSPSVGFAFRDAPQVLLCKLLGRKVVIHLRGGKVEGFWGGNILRRFWSNLGSKLADYIFVITRDCEKFAREKFGNSKVVYVPNYIDCSSISESSTDIPVEFKNDKFNIIHVAFQCKEKGTFEIIEAAKSLPDNVSISLIGIVSDDNRDKILDSISDVGVSEKVRLLGPIDKPRLWDYYKNADVMLFPSHSEGFPNVVMEAMLWGLPILATNVGAIKEMTAADTDTPAAIMLGENDPSVSFDISEKIKIIMSDSNLRDKLSQNATERVKGYYSVDVVLPKLESVLGCISNNVDTLTEAKKHFRQDEI